MTHTPNDKDSDSDNDNDRWSSICVTVIVSFFCNSLKHPLITNDCRKSHHHDDTDDDGGVVVLCDGSGIGMDRPIVVE